MISNHANLRCFVASIAWFLTVVSNQIALTNAVAAEEFPARTVRLIEGYAPGGPVDLVARILSEKLAEMWKQPVIVESRVGASGTIAAREVAQAAPDGYTLLLSPSNHVQTPSLIANLPFDPIADFTAIREFADVPLILVVNPSLPVASLSEFIEYAKRVTPTVSIATSGSGGLPHLAAAQLAIGSKLEFLYVPYGGVAPAQLAVISGEVNAMFLAPPLAVPSIKDGRLRALATTGSKRWRDLPEIPTIAEARQPKYEASVWLGVLGPAKMPAELVSKIESDIRSAVETPGVRARLIAAGYDILDAGPEQFSSIMKDDLARWNGVIRTVGITPQ